MGVGVPIVLLTSPSTFDIEGNVGWCRHFHIVFFPNDACDWF